jgi:hypothetical protein
MRSSRFPIVAMPALNGDLGIGPAYVPWRFTVLPANLG